MAYEVFDSPHEDQVYELLARGKLVGGTFPLSLAVVQAQMHLEANPGAQSVKVKQDGKTWATVTRRGVKYAPGARPTAEEEETQ